MHRSNIGKENKKPKNGTTKAFALAINTGSAREVKMSSLCLLLEFGSSEDKEKAREELTAIAYWNMQQNVAVGDSDNNNLVDVDNDSLSSVKRRNSLYDC